MNIVPISHLFVFRPAAGTSKKMFSKQSRTIRPNLAPGTIAIMLAGVHKGKRCIVLKHLATGLLLITGKTTSGCYSVKRLLVAICYRSSGIVRGVEF
jgi:hypothetical protein